jgi:hypothetical protein
MLWPLLSTVSSISVLRAYTVACGISSHTDACAFSSPLQVVNNAALPLYISPEVADTILFIGKAVWLLRHPAGNMVGQDLLPNR